MIANLLRLIPFLACVISHCRSLHGRFLNLNLLNSQFASGRMVRSHLQRLCCWQVLLIVVLSTAPGLMPSRSLEFASSATESPVEEIPVEEIPVEECPDQVEVLAAMRAPCVRRLGIGVARSPAIATTRAALKRPMISSALSVGLDVGEFSHRLVNCMRAPLRC